MTKPLCLSARAKFAAGAIFIGALIFLPAGTHRYPQGWMLPFIW